LQCSIPVKKLRMREHLSENRLNIKAPDESRNADESGCAVGTIMFRQLFTIIAKVRYCYGSIAAMSGKAFVLCLSRLQEIIY
jgi:hypothetical protein